MIASRSWVAVAGVLALAGCAAEGARPDASASDASGASAAAVAVQGLPRAVLVPDGEGRAVALALGGLVANGEPSSGFGWRTRSGGGGQAHHDGIDIRAPEGTPVRAAAAGAIAEIGTRGAYGLMIRVRHGGRVETVYAHLAGFAGGLAVGGAVQAGQVLGGVGRTGNATGAHLHFEVRIDRTPMDPLGFPAAP